MAKPLNSYDILESKINNLREDLVAKGLDR